MPEEGLGDDEEINSQDMELKSGQVFRVPLVWMMADSEVNIFVRE
jgi:hypothetical protein